MSASKIISFGLAFAFLSPAASLAQDAARDAINAPASKVIGKTSADQAGVVPSLIVLNAASASLEGGVLTLEGVPPNVIVFADRPVRAAGHMLTAHLVEDWDVGSDSFAKDPPNATISVFSKDASSVKDIVAVLTSPKLDGDKLTFAVDVLEGGIAGAEGPASVFIDILGVRRRAFRRGAYYGAAVATGAAPYYYPPHYYPPPVYTPRCGYYPYPPCH